MEPELHPFDNSKLPAAQPYTPEGNSFAQGAGRSGRGGKRGRVDTSEPASHCKKEKDDDKRSQTPIRSTAKDAKQSTKDLKKIRTQLAQLQEDQSDLSESDDEAEEASHFQLQFAQLDEEFESGRCCYGANDQLTLANKVSENKERSTKRRIKDCCVTVQDVGVAHKKRGKNSTVQRGKSIRSETSNS